MPPKKIMKFYSCNKAHTKDYILVILCLNLNSCVDQIVNASLDILNQEQLLVLGLQTKHLPHLFSHYSQINKEDKKLHHEGTHTHPHCFLFTHKMNKEKQKRAHGSDAKSFSDNGTMTIVVEMKRGKKTRLMKY